MNGLKGSLGNAEAYSAGQNPATRRFEYLSYRCGSGCRIGCKKAPPHGSTSAGEFRKEVAVKLSVPCARTLLFVPLLCIAWHQSLSQEKPQENSKAAAAPEQATSNASERKNPVKPTPENLGEAKKFFGYDCAMCHGASGDGKGDLASSMGLKMTDWRDTSTVAGMSDGELFDVIVKGKGKMEGEGDRIKAEMAWKLVNYVRTLAKNEPVGTPK
jgi:mono/diheme cytochrome c family protein